MFKQLRKEKQLIDREIELYRQEQLLAIDKKIEDYRATKQIEMLELAKQCAEQTGGYEHTFHHNREVKGIEIAKLEAKIEYLDSSIKVKESIILNDKLLTTKDVEIKRLNDIITLLINKQPQHTTTIQQLK